MAGNYGGAWATPGVVPTGYDPYNPGATYGYPGPYNRFMPGNGNQPPAVPSVAPAQLPMQSVQQNSNVPWIQVPNIEAARNVMVQPNQTAYMMNQNAPEFYVKATDAMGVATLRCFKFHEYDPTQEAAKEVLSSQAGNLVSREEFTNFANAVSAQFNALQQGINAGNVNTQATQQVPVMTAPMQSNVQETPNIPLIPTPTPLVPQQEMVVPKKETTTSTSKKQKETTA